MKFWKIECFLVFLFLVIPCFSYQKLGIKPIENKTQSVGKTTDQTEKYQMNFKDADISTVISLLAELIGKSIIIPPNLKGKITVVSPKEDIGRAEALSILEAMLSSMGYSLVEQKEHYSIVLEGDPTKRGILPPMTKMGKVFEDKKNLKNDISIYFDRPVYEDVKDLRSMLIPFSSKGGTIQSHDKTNTIIICDSQEYVQRIRELISYFDVPKKNIKIEMINLEYANVKSVLQYLNVLINNPKFKERFASDERSQETKLLSEERTNSLIVAGTKKEIESIREIIKLIDVKTDYERELKIYDLQYLDCNIVARELQGIFAKNPPVNSVLKYDSSVENKQKYIPDASIIISPLSVNNSIVVVANNPTHLIISDILEQFDVGGDSRSIFKIIVLDYAEAEIVVKDVEALLAGKNQNPALSKFIQPKLIPNNRLNSVMILAPNSEVIRHITEIIKEMDVRTPKERNTTHVYYLENAEAKTVADVLTKVSDVAGKKGQTESDQITIVSDDSTNSLLIKCSREKYESLLGIIKSLDIVKSQVMIEVLIAEVSLANSVNYGIDWGVLNKDFGDQRVFAGSNYNIRAGALNNQGLTVGLIKAGETLDADLLSKGNIGELSKIQAIMNAHMKDTNFNILSAPQILTTNNSEATITVGEVIPFPTDTVSTGSSSDLTRSSFKYEDVGIDLKVTPRINQKNYVTLQINQEIKTKTTETQNFGSNTFAIPIIGKRVANTNVTVKNGDTIIIAGLISEENTIVEDKIPILGDIPLIGRLFRKKSKEKKKKNLMVFITPHIITSLEEMEGYNMYSEEGLNKRRRKIKAHNIKIKKHLKPNPNPVTVSAKKYSASPRVVVDFQKYLDNEKLEKNIRPAYVETVERNKKLDEVRDILKRMKKTFGEM